jgi:hypothetical protein
MATLSRRPRLLAFALGVAVLAGLAAGIAVARGGSKPVSKGRAGVVSSGTFRTITWGTTGTATVIRDSAGHLKVRFGKDFTTKRGPDVWVYLAKFEGSIWKGNHVEWDLIGRLKRGWGRQTYDLPAAAAKPGMSIAIFCGECGRLSGLAQLQPARPATRSA